MHIIRVDHETITAGREVFHKYIARAVCGSGSSAYQIGNKRETGAHGIIGCIMECIDHGLTNEDDIVYAVARATLCRKSTVEAFLDFLTGEDPAKHLWLMVGAHYRCLEKPSVSDDDQIQILLAA